MLRVGGARDFVVRLNGVAVASGAGDDEARAFPVPPALLRAGTNALALEGHVEGDETARALARALALLLPGAR